MPYRVASRRPPWRTPVRVLALLAVLLPLAAVPGAAASGVWEPVGPDGGSVTTLERGMDGQVHAVTAAGSVFVSRDRGVSWELTGLLPLADPYGAAVVADPVRSDRLHLLAGDGAVWRSADAGATWEMVRAGGAEEGSVLVEAMALVAGSTTGAVTVLLRLLSVYGEPGSAPPPHAELSSSIDGGRTWRTFGTGLPAAEPRDVALVAGDRSLVLVATAAGLYRSTDGGATFLPPAGPPVAGPVAAVALSPSDPARAVAVDDAGRVLTSRDRGLTWSVTGVLPPGGVLYRRLAVHPSDPERMYALRPERVLWSRDGGRVWRQAPAFGDGPWSDLRAHAMLPPRDAGESFLVGLDQHHAPLVAETTGGVWSGDGEDAPWQPSSSGLRGVTAPALAVAPGEPPALYLSLSDRLWTLPAGEGGWRPLATQPPALGSSPFFSRAGALAVHPRFPERLVVGTGQGVDETWTAAAPPGATSVWLSRQLVCLSARELHLAATAPTVIYASGSYPYRGCEKEDECALYRLEWERSECIRGTPVPNQGSELAVDPRDADRLWAHGGGELWRRDGAGAAWTLLPPVPFPLADLVADPLTPDRLHAADRDGAVWRSGDGGATWVRRGPPLTPGLAHQLVLDPVEPRRLYLVSAGGVHASGDGGTTWTPLAAGLPAGARVLQLALDPADPLTLYASVAGAGVWRLDRRLPAAPCVPDVRTLCLGDGGRFRVRVTWRDFAGVAGAGGAVPLTVDTGSFWFFRPQNRELLVKVLDGRPVNGHHWVFYASLTNVPFTLVVTDTATGESQGYRNPERLFASRGDTWAFPEGRPHAFPGPPLPAELPQRDVVEAAPCMADEATLCLGDGRFRVEVEWQLVIGGAGRGRVVPGASTGDSGAFWFFRPDNVELAVKVLDGRPVNGYHWVFNGSLTNVAFRLRVTDTATGRRVTYVNAGGSMASRGDTTAFAGAATGSAVPAD